MSLDSIWPWAANPLASIAAGILVLAILLTTRRHRARDGSTVTSRIVGAFLFGLATYTFLILIIGHFSHFRTLSAAIHTSFGDDRVAWLIVGITIDQFARLYRIFDPPPQTAV